MTHLPDGFADLEPFLEKWARPHFQDRFTVRCESTMDDIRAFYDAMLPRVEAVLEALGDQPLDRLKGPWRRLFDLLMAFAHVGMAVERHGQPRAANTRYPTTLRVVQGSTPP